MENVTEKIRIAATNYVDNFIIDDIWKVEYLKYDKELPRKDYDRIQFSGNDLVEAFMRGAKFGLSCR